MDEDNHAVNIEFPSDLLEEKSTFKFSLVEPGSGKGIDIE
jgi:hypothetical protein